MWRCWLAGEFSLAVAWRVARVGRLDEKGAKPLCYRPSAQRERAGKILARYRTASSLGRWRTAEGCKRQGADERGQEAERVGSSWGICSCSGRVNQVRLQEERARDATLHQPRTPHRYLIALQARLPDRTALRCYATSTTPTQEPIESTTTNHDDENCLVDCDDPRVCQSAVARRG